MTIYNYHYLIGWTSNEKRAETLSFFRHVSSTCRDTYVHRNGVMFVINMIRLKPDVKYNKL